MRSCLAAILLAALSGTATAQPEKRIFIIANYSDGYGVDRCLAKGEQCGSAAAMAYCRAREFSRAVSFHRVDKDDITGAIPVNAAACRGGSCEEFVAIECAR